MQQKTGRSGIISNYTVSYFKAYSFVILLSLSGICLGQCPTAQFSDVASACRKQNIQWINSSVGATSYYWDFCADDLKATPTSEQIPTSKLAHPYSYKTIHDNDQWYGFIVDRAFKKVFRVDYGVDLNNTTPLITDLGSFNGLFDSPSVPEDIDMIKVNNVWYAMISRDGFAGIVLLDFGTDIKNNSPQATNLGTFGIGSKIRGVSLAYDGSKIIAVLSSSNQNLTLINFRTSPYNIPDVTDIKQISIAGGSPIFAAIDVLQTCGGWYIYAGTYGTNKIHRLKFGTDLFTVPSDITTYNIAGINEPWDVDVILEGDKAFLAVSDLTNPYVLLSLGDINANETPVIISSANPFSNKAISMDVVLYKGSYIFTSIYYATSEFRQTVYSSSCGASVSYSTDALPPVVSYTTAGSHEVLLLTENSTTTSGVHKTTIVTNDESPIPVIQTTNICAGHDVLLTTQNVSGITSYQWDFGDGSQVSTDHSPTHQFSSANTYTIGLDVQASNGCENHVTTEIEIYESPVASFSLPGGLLCTNNEFTFTNTTADNFQGNLTYEWFVDDLLVATNRDLNYIFENTGVRSIKLVASIPGCDDANLQTTSELYAGPAVDFSFTGKCEDSEIHFLSLLTNEINSFAWQFPVATTVLDLNPSYVFQNAGEYLVSLSATNSVGCNTTKTKTVKIYSKPSPDFSIEAPPQSCSDTATPFQNTTPDLTDSNITSWRWIFGDDDPGSDISELKSPSHIFADAGTYKVLLKAKTDKECEATLEKEITIAQSPNAEFSNTATCKEALSTFTSSGADIKTYYWEIGTSYYLNKSVNHTFNTSGEHDVKLSVTGTNNCNSFKAKRVKVPVPLTPSFSVWKNCVAYEAEFTDNTSGADPVAWRQWNFDGTIKENVQQTKFPISEFEVLPTTLTVKGESGCVYSKRMDVNVFHAPVANFEVTPLRGAAPLEVSFENLSESATKYQWTFFDATTFTSEEFEPTFTFNQIGEHAIELKAANEVGCESVVSKTIDAENPAADVEIKVMTVSQNPDKTLKVIVTLQNNGNTILRDLPVNIDISGIFSFKEIIEEPIRPKEQYNLVLSYGITKNQDLNFLCAQAELAGDLTFEGNKACTQFEKTVLLLSPYPNPVTETLNIEWIGKVNHRVNVLITDSFGKAILQKDIDSIDGFNHQFFDVTQLKEGLYFLVLNDGFTQKTQRIIISRKN